MSYATTVEQSKHLLELGLDPLTADNCHIGYLLCQQPYSLKLSQWLDYYESQSKPAPVDKLRLTPAWSLSRLLDLIPLHLDTTQIKFTYQLTMNIYGTIFEPELMEADNETKVYGDLSITAFSDRWVMFYDGQMPGVQAQGPHIVDAAVKMIDWLVANNIPLNSVNHD